MNKALEEAASTRCNDECEKGNFGFDLKDIGKNKIFIIIIIIAIIACSGGGFPGNNGIGPCMRPSRCGGGGGGSGGIWGLLVLAFLFAGNGIGGLGGAGTGNVNTNVINVGPEEECCEEPCNNCC
ncbi:MAG: hypothetical protein Q8930_04580 [Bacillota bacterium]|nr:hypothetical protein [Bacillota bacterium]